jgi:hypothetical protein
VGSSAQFESASIAAYNLAGAGAGHYTLSNGGQIVDTREAGIANQTGNLSVIWNAAQTQVWYYLSVDSIVGNRAYFAQPRTTLNVPGGGLTAPSNSISASLWGTDATSVPTAVETAIQGSQFTAAFTDVLPADAEFAEQRVNCTGTPNLTGPPTSPLGGGTGPAGVGCLGYAPGAVAHVGQPILTAFNTGSSALPVDFNITGTDPLGVAPVIFIANKSNPNGLGAGGGATFTGLNTPTSAEELFSGANCNTNAFGLNNGINVAVNPILREPMSGTMNTAEFNIFVQGPPPTAGLYFSQEALVVGSVSFWYIGLQEVNPAAPAGGTNNPLGGLYGSANPAPLQNCGLTPPFPAGYNGLLNGAPGNPYFFGLPQGNRLRAIGTGEVVGKASNNSGVYNVPDSIGYTFFSYGNVSPLASPTAPKVAADYAYLTYGENKVNGVLAGIDPINPSGSYNVAYNPGGGAPDFPGGGLLPTCTKPCPLPAGVLSFPNIRNGAYQQFSVLRAVADANTPAITNLAALATGIQQYIVCDVPDFVPFNPVTVTCPGASAPVTDPGFIGYRSHFSPVGVTYPTGTPNDGLPTAAPYTQETGGDVAGCVELKPANGGPNPPILNCRN